MRTATLVSVQEYLETSYRPDVNYIDGVLEDRNVGEQPHGDVQMLLGSLFRAHRQSWGVRVLGDTRVQVTPTRYQLPDVCVIRNTDPKDPIITWAPLLCIEILSKKDSLRSLRERVDGLLSCGSHAVWLIDPWQRKGYTAAVTGYEEPEDAILRVPGTAIEVSLLYLFEELDAS